MSGPWRMSEQQEEECGIVLTNALQRQDSAVVDVLVEDHFVYVRYDRQPCIRWALAPDTLRNIRLHGSLRVGDSIHLIPPAQAVAI